MKSWELGLFFQPGQSFSDAAHTLFNIFHGGSKGEADKFIGTKGRSRHRGHLGLVEEEIGQFNGVVYHLVLKFFTIVGGKIREDIKGPGRLHTVYTG